MLRAHCAASRSVPGSAEAGAASIAPALPLRRLLRREGGSDRRAGGVSRAPPAANLRALARRAEAEVRWPTSGPQIAGWAMKCRAGTRCSADMGRLYLAIALPLAILLTSHTELRLHTHARSPAPLQADSRVRYRAATSKLPSRCSRRAEDRPRARSDAPGPHGVAAPEIRRRRGPQRR